MPVSTALVTGASYGIGEVFCRALAQQDHDLILVARSRDKLEALAVELRAKHGRQVAVIPADLCHPGCGAALAAAVAAQGLTVDILINNAGSGLVGDFAEQAPAGDQQMIALNVSAVVDLAHAFLPDMIKRGHGGIINVASLAAFQPMAYMAMYAATKAFVLSFSESLWAEVRDKGVTVTALCPGPVGAPRKLSRRRGLMPSPVFVTAEMVVAHALEAFERGRSVAVPGTANKIVSLFPRLVTRSFMASDSARMMG